MNQQEVDEMKDQVEEFLGEFDIFEAGLCAQAQTHTRMARLYLDLCLEHLDLASTQQLPALGEGKI